MILRVLGSLAVLTSVSCALAQDFSDELPKGLPTILVKAIRKANEQRYTGTRLVQFKRGPNLESHQEYIVRDGKRVRIEFPSDSPMAGQIIVEDGRDRYHYLPESNLIRVLPPRREEAYRHLLWMLRGPRGREFSFNVAGPSRVASYRVTQVVAKDDDGNVIQRLYIEPGTGIVLKRILYDPLGTEVGGYYFTEIDLTPRISNDVFRIVRRGAKYERPEDKLVSLAKENGFLYRLLPVKSGYRLEDTWAFRPMGVSTLMQIYSSDHGRLSLFQVSQPVDEEKLARYGGRRLNTYSWTDGGKTFVIVGSNSKEELVRLGRMVGDRR